MLLILRGFNQGSTGVYNTWNPFVLYFGGWTLQNKVELPIKTIMWVPGICFFLFCGDTKPNFFEAGGNFDISWDWDV